MSKHLDDLANRRLQNLDAAIVYYSKRLASYRRSRDKLLSSDPSDPKALVYDSLIVEIGDVLSYLKLC